VGLSKIYPGGRKEVVLEEGRKEKINSTNYGGGFMSK
jgi:hypothetical protein